MPTGAIRYPRDAPREIRESEHFNSWMRQTRRVPPSLIVVARPARNQTTETRIVQYSSPSRARIRPYAVECRDHAVWISCKYKTTREWLARHPQHWCRECGDLRRARRKFNNTQPHQPHARRFGLEIECFSPTLDLEEIYSEFVAIGFAPKNFEGQDLTKHWDVKDDPSVRGHGESVEVCSPPLRNNAKARDAVRAACEILQNAGCKINNTCGLHIHLDMERHSADVLRRFVLSYNNYQDQIDYMHPKFRRRHEYSCRPDSYVLDTLHKAKERRDCYIDERYSHVNIEAWPKHGTVELRQHAGTLSADKIFAWLEFCDRLFSEAVIAAEPLQPTDGLVGLFKKLKISEETTTTLLGRALALGANSEIMYGRKLVAA